MVDLNLDKIPHALALTGPMESARRAADALAGRLVRDTRLGVLVIEPEGQHIKLEAARRINDFLALTRITPARVIIVVDAQSLNPQATNAMLKIVEEPPPSTYFLFLVPEISQLLPTLRSRVQVIRLKPEPRVLNEVQTEMVEPVRAFLRACFERRRDGLGEFLESAKDRESASTAAYVMQIVLRDWAVNEHTGGFPDWQLHDRVELWRDSHRLEGDLHGNVDRALAFENFYYRVGHVD